MLRDYDIKTRIKNKRVRVSTSQSYFTDRNEISRLFFLQIRYSHCYLTGTIIIEPYVSVYIYIYNQ